MDKIEIKVDVTGLREEIEAVKRMKAELEYYKDLVEKYLPLFIPEKN